MVTESLKRALVTLQRVTEIKSWLPNSIWISTLKLGNDSTLCFLELFGGTDDINEDRRKRN